MRWSYKVARVAGIDVKIHVTFLLVLAYFGAIYWRQGGLAGAVEGVGFTLLLFLCVLLHEFGHAFAARLYGIRTPDITLLPIGGVARLERMPDKPVQEFVVAIAGPAVNVVIALGLLAFLATKVRMSDITELDQGGLLESLLAMNVMLVAFNAIPAFPMDGGRVLRALLAMVMDHTKATLIAARVGQVLAVGFAVWSFSGGPTMLLFIAFFVFAGAQQELAYARFRSGGGSRRVSDVMFSGYSSIPTETPIAHALALAKASRQGVFPIVDHQLRAIGIVSVQSLEKAMADGFGGHPADDLAQPVARIQGNALLTAAMATIPPRVPVVVENPSGQIVGLLAVQG
ncbi:MAG: site-2 protease family protein [Verrucomicrobia bacterium]|nr:site-2 protease family protein [Verrucomicrobiota bacterium]